MGTWSNGNFSITFNTISELAQTHTCAQTYNYGRYTIGSLGVHEGTFTFDSTYMNLVGSNPYIMLYGDSSSSDVDLHNFGMNFINGVIDSIAIGNTTNQNSLFARTPDRTQRRTVTIDTTVPIFDNQTDVNAYLQNPTVEFKRALNYHANVEPNHKDFEITNIWTHGTWSLSGHTESGQVNYRSVRGKIEENGKISLYKIEGIDNGALKYGVNISADVYALEYTTDGVTWHTTSTFPFDFFYRERVDELGEFDYGLTFVSVFPTWETQSDSTDYIQGTKDITEAPNYDKIALLSKDIVNTTGVGDVTTDFGEIYTRSLFSQQYICSESVLTQIANGLYDTSNGGIFENIKKGVEMFGNNAIESVLSLVYYPMDLTGVFTNVSSQSYVYFGGYKFDLTNASVNKIIYPNGYKDLGTFDIKPTFKNYRDYEPYTKLRVYLPYIGWQQLDVKRYLGKSVKVRYYIDTRTNGQCVACLIANGLLTDYFTGQIGVSMPMTLTDYSSYANSQIETLLGGTTSAGGNVSDVASGVSTLAQGGSIGAMGVAGVVGAEVGAVASISKTVYSLGSNNINNYNATKGTCSSMINMYLPQEVMFEFEIQDLDDTSNAVELRGYPSNASGQVNNFSGYLEIQEIKLNCPSATESEKSEIIQLLNSGVYI